jgi:hypothetical protein
MLGRVDGIGGWLLVICGFWMGCEEVRTASGSPPTPAARSTEPAAGRAPATKLASAPLSAAGRWSSKDARQLVSHLVAELLRGGRIKQYQASHGGRKPVVGLSIEIPRPDAALDEGTLRTAMAAALKRQGGLKVVVSYAHPKVYALDPSNSVKLTFSPGVGPSSGRKPGLKGPHWSLRTRVTWRDAPGAEQRTYKVDNSAVALDGSVQFWSGQRSVIRRRPPARKVAAQKEVSCATGPRWISQQACVHRGFAYAVSVAVPWQAGQIDTTTAAIQALLRPLAVKRGGHVKLTINSVEAVDAFRCEGALYLLLRTKQRQIVRAGLRACARAKVTARTPLPRGCPAWTRQRFGRRGRQIFGVAVVHHGERASLDTQRRSAKRNAGHSTRRVMEVWHTAQHKGIAGNVPAPRLSGEAIKLVNCGERRFVRYTAELARP